jgi:hypothetical protein
VEPAKVQDYLLSREHSVGRFKAAFFASLGYDAARWQELEADLRNLAQSAEARLGDRTRYGQKYEIDGTLIGPRGKSASVRTVWIVRFGEEVPRFVTAFPGGRA